MESGLLIGRQPASFKALLHYSKNLYSASLVKVIVYSLILSIVFFTPRLIFDVTGYNAINRINPLSWTHLWLLFLDLFVMWMLTAIFYRIDCIVHRKHESYAEDLFVALRKLLFVFVAVILQSLLMFAVVMITYFLEIILVHYHLLFYNDPIRLGLTLIVFLAQSVLIIYLITLFLFLVPLIVTDDSNVFHSLRKAIRLVWNHGWRAISLQAVPWIGYAIILICIKLFLGIQVSLYFASNYSNIYATLIQIIIFALFVPWSASLLYVQLHDLELRKKLAVIKPKKKQKYGKKRRG